MEIGHIFQLGRKFADAFGLDVLGPDSKPVRVTMGSYGIGVSRAVAPSPSSPTTRRGWSGRAPSRRWTCTSSASARASRRPRPSGWRRRSRSAAWSCCSTTGRRSRPGVAFKDAELIGVPTSVVIGRGLDDGEVELRDRRSGESRTVALEGLVETVLAEVRG
jgi:prolyl-tRNA synthetase